MHHNLPLVTTLATALGLALMMGFIATKLRLPVLIGYLVAGVIIGPFTPGIFANTSIAGELAEIGVILLMFGVGLHFSLENLLDIKKIALPGALLQIVVATCLGSTLAILWGWEVKQALVFGLALSVASTVVLIRSLESQSLLNTINGQIAIGWLIVEDLAMIVVLVFLPFISDWFGASTVGHEGKNLWLSLGLTFFKITSFIVLMLFVGRWILPKLLWQIAKTGSRELFTLCVIAVAVCIAFGASELFDVSIALGSFFAGMIIRESEFSRRAAEKSLPFRDAFSVLFFVSVGMMFNPYIFVEHPYQVLCVVAIIIVGKSIAATAFVLALGYSLNTALTVSASLAQIGEFSFILASQGLKLKLLTTLGQELILAGAILSIALNPLLFKIINPLQTWIRAFFGNASFLDGKVMELPQNAEKKILTNHVLVIGYGLVGKGIGKILEKNKIPFVVVDQNRELVKKLRSRQMTAVFGSGSEPWALIQANIKEARLLVVATSDAFDIRQMLTISKKLNPHLSIVIRAENEEEKILLGQEVKGAFFLGEEELAKSISEYILNKFGTPV
ncbi:MAG: cation:proton antiporter [Legionella sp.]|nr:cation:proton antiporter [Legionella sp.]